MAELQRRFATEESAVKIAGLNHWQKAAVLLIKKHGLNDKQILAFLLLVDQAGNQQESKDAVKPLRLLVTGPGGTGKSRIFEAWTEFHALIGAADKLRLTGPTGVVASDIGGSTTHSELSLCVKHENMKADTPNGKKIRETLEKRLAGVETLIVDEVYFLGAADMSVLNE
ncbi:hypothetical protein C8R45DRAFT_811134, partial [Mycena sanguinolenta]